MSPSLRSEAFAQNPLPMAFVDRSARVVQVNDAYVSMSRRPASELLGSFSIDFVHADDLGGVMAGVAELEAGARVVRHRRRHLRGDGTWVEVDALTSPVIHDGDRYWFVQLLELGDASNVESASEAQARLVIQPFGDVACFHDEHGRIEFATPNVCDMLGYPVDWLLGRTLTDPAFHPIDTDREPITAADDPIVEALRTDDFVTRTIGLRSSGGDIVWISVLAGHAGSGVYAARSTMRNITELVDAQQEARMLAAMVERELTARANRDSLTGLQARHVATHVIEARLEIDEHVSVVFVDLDKFKAINDEFGHVIGDEVLVAVAERLRMLGPGALAISRTGGDEFVAVFGGADEANEFAGAVSRSSLTPPSLPQIGASVGVSHADDGTTGRDLVARADQEMYRSKRRLDTVARGA